MLIPHSLTVSPHNGHLIRRALFALAVNVEAQCSQFTGISGAGKSGRGGNSPGGGKSPSGGNSPEQHIEAGPGYQTGFASKIRSECGLPTMAVGQIVEPQHAEAILRSGQADMISIARGMLCNPRWAWQAAECLNEEAAYAPQYMRASKALSGLPIPGNPPTVKSS